MKTTDNDMRPLWGDAEVMDELRKELHKRLSCEAVEYSWRLKGLAALLQEDPVTLYVSWIQPLLAAGVALEVAIAGIAESHFLPN
jgi:hypothetical protein